MKTNTIASCIANKQNFEFGLSKHFSFSKDLNDKKKLEKQGKNICTYLYHDCLLGSSLMPIRLKTNFK